MNIEAKELSKIYGSGESRVVALDKVNLEIASSDFISIMGPSGSGKSTLLHLLSGLDKPTSGSLTYDGKDIYRFNDKELSSFRRRRIGFIFQQFNLLPVLTAKENIIILNIINTVYSNIHTRVGEIGMQRAIGMSAASLYKTFLWEGAYYGIIASVIGAVFGYVCCIFVGAAQTDALQLVAVPVMAIVEAAIISIVACLLATAIPLRSIARMSIVDSIETVE